MLKSLRVPSRTQVLGGFCNKQKNLVTPYDHRLNMEFTMKVSLFSDISSRCLSVRQSLPRNGTANIKPFIIDYFHLYDNEHGPGVGKLYVKFF